MRPPQDQLSQHQLVAEMRCAIDLAAEVRPEGWSSEALSCMQNVATLVEQNPHAIRGTHVRYNLGLRRLEWLRPLIAFRT